jgi:hypothetical protein
MQDLRKDGPPDPPTTLREANAIGGEVSLACSHRWVPIQSPPVLGD